MAKNRTVKQSVFVHGERAGHEDRWFHPGDQMPDWAMALVGDHVFESPEEMVVPEETGPQVFDSDPTSTPEPEEVNYMAFNKSDLEAMLAERGLSTSGNKSELSARLRDSDASLG